MTDDDKKAIEKMVEEAGVVASMIMENSRATYRSRENAKEHAKLTTMLLANS